MIATVADTVATTCLEGLGWSGTASQLSACIPTKPTEYDAVQDGRIELLISGFQVRVLGGSPLSGDEPLYSSQPNFRALLCGRYPRPYLATAEHNTSETNPSRWTRSRGPWEMVLHKVYASDHSALLAERFVKRMKSARFIEKLISGEYVLPSFEE
jgi:predicted GIY-YIG superfamily endonuclease